MDEDNNNNNNRFSMPGTHWINGIPYHVSIPADIVKKIPDLPVFDDDIYVTGYPKSGDTAACNNDSNL